MQNSKDDERLRTVVRVLARHKGKDSDACRWAVQAIQDYLAGKVGSLDAAFCTPEQDTNPKQTARRGRPPGEVIPGNIASLSFFAQELREKAEAAGQNLSIKDSIRQVMQAALDREIGKGFKRRSLRVEQIFESTVRQEQQFRRRTKEEKAK